MVQFVIRFFLLLRTYVVVYFNNLKLLTSWHMAEQGDNAIMLLQSVTR
jgi:hypothetical protein